MAEGDRQDGPGRIDTTRLQDLARAYTRSAVLYTAIDVELFTHVHRGADTEAALADATGLRPVDVDRLVTCCLSLDLLRWADPGAGRLENAPDVDRYLVKGQRGYAGPWMSFTRPDAAKWFRMTELMREGEPTLLGMYDDLTPEAARQYHRATSSIGFGAARRFVRSVDLSGRRHLLDLGGGSGAYSITAVKAFDGLTATVLDLPPVVEATRDYIEEHDVVGRVDTHAADFTRGEFPPCDVVVMASNLPIYDGEVIAGVVARAFRALDPGGEMHLIGEMLDDDRRGPVDAAMWGMNELVCGSLGRAHSRGECAGYFAAAGFVDVEVNDFVPGTLARCCGRKPA